MVEGGVNSPKRSSDLIMRDRELAEPFANGSGESPLQHFLYGAFSLIVIEALVTAIVLMKAHGLSAPEQLTSIERWIARRARQGNVHAEYRTAPNCNTLSARLASEVLWPQG